MIGTARVLRRVWQIYTAHLLLFLVLMAEIAFVTTISEKPAFYIQEMEVGEFFRQPGSEIIQALFLRFRPLNMDVLPLYVVLMAFLPLVLLVARLHRDLPLACSVALYILTLRYDLHLSTYPNGFWSFNPCAWQLLFVFGAWCALGGGNRLSPILNCPSSLLAGHRLSLRCVLHHHDMVFSVLGIAHPRAWLTRADLSDQQDRFRRTALCAFPGARRRRAAFRTG